MHLINVKLCCAASGVFTRRCLRGLELWLGLAPGREVTVKDSFLKVSVMLRLEFDNTRIVSQTADFFF